MRRIFLLFFSLLLLLHPVSGHSETTRYALWYKVYWSGLHVGDLVTEVQHTGAQYEIRTRTRARGLAWTFSQFYSDSYTQGELKGGGFQPRRFDTSFHLRKRGLKHILLEYDGNGKITRTIYDPPENRDKRPEVPPEQRDGSPDPQTLALQLQQMARAYHASLCGETVAACATRRVLLLFDGRRRSDVAVRVPGVFSETIRDRRYTAVRLTIRREPVAGYTANELERVGEEEPDIHIFIPAQEPFVPVKLTAEAMLGTASALLESRCDTLEACQKQMEAE